MEFGKDRGLFRTYASPDVSSEAFTAVNIQVKVSWVHPEDGGSMDLWNNGSLPQHYMASQPRKPWLEFANPIKALYENAKCILQPKVINLHCSDGLRSKFKETDMLSVFLKTTTKFAAEGSCMFKLVQKYLLLWTNFLLDKVK